jgi:hypothetical protein
MELTVDDKRLLSMGMTDQTLLQWRIDSIYENDDEKENEKKKQPFKVPPLDDSLVNELNFCYSDSVTTAITSQVEQFKDSTVLIRGS